MGRRPNPQRKVDLLSEIVDYILENGLSDLSLRPLAKELGTSTYTLTYQFGSKEAMVTDAVEHIDERQAERLASKDAAGDSPEEVLQNLWELSIDEQGRRWSQVMLEVATVTSRQPILFDTFEAKALNGRISHLAKAIADGPKANDADISKATSAIAAVNGLVLDVLLTGDMARTETALRSLISGLSVPVTI